MAPHDDSRNGVANPPRVVPDSMITKILHAYRTRNLRRKEVRAIMESALFQDMQMSAKLRNMRGPGTPGSREPRKARNRPSISTAQSNETSTLITHRRKGQLGGARPPTTDAPAPAALPCRAWCPLP